MIETAKLRNDRTPEYINDNISTIGTVAHKTSEISFNDKSETVAVDSKSSGRIY